MKGKVTAIVPAAGLGKRFGEKANKPFVRLSGKPLLVWALEVLEAMPEVGEIIPVLKDGDMEAGVEILDAAGITKARRIAPGGRERQDSVFHGLKLVDDRSGIVLVHDGVRPLIEASVISGAIRQLKDCDGVVVGVPVKDTIKEVAGGEILKTLSRDALWAVQTPQVFRCDLLFRAYEKAMKDGFYSTDDSALVERYGGRIRMAAGSYRNIKITTPEDLQVADMFLSLKGKAS
ncbi:MAG: 2-C-methyl-D-erythritol 4-phosphate cytidylyltransferase [Nitrospiraceae bacterium]|nr:2-C-methyl-D-erythritol 4-phosphate cytidylyltransferase [Nitrospiraceae bacterium]